MKNSIPDTDARIEIVAVGPAAILVKVVASDTPPSHWIRDKTEEKGNVRSKLLYEARLQVVSLAATLKWMQSTMQSRASLPSLLDGPCVQKAGRPLRMGIMRALLEELAPSLLHERSSVPNWNTNECCTVENKRQ